MKAVSATLPWAVSWMLKGLTLTEEQKAKVDALRKEYEPKLNEAMDSVLTADQKQASDTDAIKAAKDAGKTGPEVFKAAMAAVNFADEQKAKMKEAVEPIGKEVREKIKAILTPKQQEQLSFIWHFRGR